MVEKTDPTNAGLTALTTGGTLPLFRQVYGDSLAAALLIGPAGELCATNAEACTLFGATEDAMCAATTGGAQALLADAADPRSERLRADSLTTGRARGNQRLRRLDGSLFEAEVASFPFFDANGRQSTVMTVRDLSASQLAERLVRESEARLGFALNAAGIGDWDMNLRTNVTRRSLRHDQCFGYVQAVPQWGYDTFISHVHPDDRERVAKSYGDAMDKAPNGDYDVEFRVLWPDGSLHWLWSKGRFYFDETGVPYRVAGIQVDITRRYLIEDLLRQSADRTRRILHAAAIGLWEWNLLTDAVYFSPEWKQQLGYADDEIANHFDEWQKLAHPDDLPRALAAVSDVRDGRVPRYAVEVRLRHKDGSWRWIYGEADLERNDKGEPVMMRGSQIDITERKLAELALRNSTEFNASVLNSLSEQIAVLDADGVIVNVNATWRRRAVLGGAKSQDDFGVGINYLRVCQQALESAADEVAGQTLAGVRSVLRREAPEFHLEYPCHSATEQHWFRIKVVPMKGNSRGAVVSHTDITDRKQAEEDTHRLAYFDALTGLPNRRLLVDRIEHAVGSAQRSGQVGALLFIDLDNFKQINDARGHLVGDRLLQQVAQRLSELLRGDDSVARLGGDEFVVLVPQLGHDVETGARHARGVADKVRDMLEQPYDIDGTLYRSAGSIGVTLFAKGDERVDDLLREADTAMYRAKSAGRNRIAFFEPEMQGEVEQRLALEQDLKEAVGSSQISVHIQPQFNADGAEVGGELLLRWCHPDRGNVSPAQFIPIAEDTGLILALGNFVILQACEALVRMQAAGRALPLSVNVSPRQFRKDDFVEHVRAVFATTGAPADAMVFEVTENLLIDDWEGARARMSELVQMGIRFSIDDFGTGYSSLAYLRKLPLFELKIDRSFVRDTPNDPSDTSIVETILSMARNLNLRVVAEGVETRAQADFLVAAGCPVLQGFLFARPQPLTDWLAQRLAPCAED